MSAAITRIPKQNFMEWYHEIFVKTIQGKKNLGEAFLDAFFPQVQDPVLRNWTVDNSAFAIILSTYADTASSKKGTTMTTTNAFASMAANLTEEDGKLFDKMITENLIDGNEEGVIKALAQIVAADILLNAAATDNNDPMIFDTSREDCVQPRLKGLLDKVSAEVAKILPDVADYAVQNFTLLKKAKDLKIEPGLVLYIQHMSIGTATVEKEYEPGHFTLNIKWDDNSKDDSHDMTGDQIRDLIMEGRFHIEKPEPMPMPKVTLIRINMIPGNVVTFEDGATLTIEEANLETKIFSCKANAPGEEEVKVEDADIAFIIGFMQKHGKTTGQTIEEPNCECCKDEAKLDPETANGVAPETDGYKLNHDEPAYGATVSGVVDIIDPPTEETKH